MMAFLLAILLMPIAIVIVTTIGKPSGTAATEAATAILNISERAEREGARHARNEAEVEKERARDRVRLAERAMQEAGFAERSARDRMADLERRREALVASSRTQQSLLEQLSSERASIDWSPVEEALQRQLGSRGEAEHALQAARERLETLGTELRAAEESRLAAEQRLDPARQKIQDMQLKEQAAALAEAQYGEQLAEAHADLAALPEAQKGFGAKSQLPGEIERLAKAIAEPARDPRTDAGDEAATEGE